MLQVEIKIARGHPAKDTIAGTITLDDKDALYGHVLDNKFKTLIQNIVEGDIVAPGGKRISPSSPREWIENLQYEYKSYALRATAPKEIKVLHADHDQLTHGNRDGGSNSPPTKAELQKHLVDFKETRPLTGPGTNAISEIISGAKSIQYMDTPGVERMHALMGIPQPTLDTDPTEYQKARDRLFNAQPLSDVPFSEMTFTQQRVNKEELAKIPEEFQRKPVQVVKSNGRYHLMNGHHRVVGQFVNGHSKVPARVLDLDEKKFHRTGWYDWRIATYHAEHDQQDHGNWANGGSTDKASSEKASSRDPRVLETLARDIEKEFSVAEKFRDIDRRLEEGTQTKELHMVNGAYTPERQKRHEEIVNGFLSSATPTDNPTIHIMGGVSGSGKSSIRAELGMSNFVSVDADDIRAQLPEYAGWNAALTQNETDDITTQLLARAWREKKNVLFDATLKTYSKFKPMIQAFKARGYNVQLSYVDTPLDVAMRNVVDRHSRTGRYVNLNYVVGQDHRNRQTFDMLSKLADGWSLYKNPTGKKAILDSKGGKV